MRRLLVRFRLAALKGEFQSGQMGQTVNLLSLDFGGSNPSSPTKQRPFRGVFLWAEMDSMDLFFISLRESAHYVRLAALRDRGLVRRLTRSNTPLSA